MAEQGTQTAQAPVTGMTEAAFSLNVKMVDKFGQEVMLTFRAPQVNQAQTLLGHYESVVDHLIKKGWQTSKAGGRQAPAPAQEESSQAASGTPTCPVHGSAMRAGNRGGFFCPKKLADGSYCKAKA